MTVVKNDSTNSKSKARDKVFCPFCRSSRLVKKGSSKTKSAIKQKYVCFNCRKLTVKPLKENALGLVV